jgi:hypothetical protein
MKGFDDLVEPSGSVGHLNGDQDAIPRTLFFGRRWDAPIVDDARQVATPVGERCMDCGEVVVEGDRGFIRAALCRDADRKWVATPRPVHAECDLRGVQGHILGLCRCTGYESDRATAVLVWDRVGQLRGRDLAIRAEDLYRQEETS